MWLLCSADSASHALLDVSVRHERSDRRVHHDAVVEFGHQPGGRTRGKLRDDVQRAVEIADLHRPPHGAVRHHDPHRHTGSPARPVGGQQRGRTRGGQEAHPAQVDDQSARARDQFVSVVDALREVIGRGHVHLAGHGDHDSTRTRRQTHVQQLFHADFPSFRIVARGHFRSDNGWLLNRNHLVGTTRFVIHARRDQLISPIRTWLVFCG
jgi:hypothetical protein